MAKRISSTFIKELVASADIVDVVSRFVNLKKSGKNYKGCCPFHNEKTPSFFVTPSKNFYHCFGCQEAGDALSFVKKINNLDFITAVESLADLTGKEIEYENFSKEDLLEQQLYNKCITILNSAQKYYRWNLGHANSSTTAINYLKNRGINGDLAKTFGIGYSSESWDGIVSIFNGKVTKDVLVESGLVIRKDNGHVYDRFRSRIMFPIRNIQGDVIAYGGRVINNDDGVKYINSPETIVFKKNAILYGLYEYRQYKKEKQVSSSIVVVEGYMDVVGLASQGFYGAVATLGTAFSQSHAKILFRETSSVTLCFDGDSAGKKAAIRAIKHVLHTLDANKTLNVLSLPDNKDPDDYIKEFGLEEFNNQINSADNVVDFLIKSFTDNKDLSLAETKVKTLENLKEFMQDVEDSIYTESIAATIANLIGININQIKNIISKKTSHNNQNYNFDQRTIKITKDLCLEEKLLAETFANVSIVREMIQKNHIELYSNSEYLHILQKTLKILKEDSSNVIETVILIQMLTEEYPQYREYFFELLSYGIENSSKQYDNDLYKEQMLDMLKRVEKLSVKKQINYLRKQVIRTDIQSMELKYLLAKLSSNN